MTPSKVAAEIAFYEENHAFRRPTRSKIDPSRPWNFGLPNYDTADLLFFRGRSKNHPAGSLEDVVENAVKNWEMEATHLPFSAWTSVDHASYKVSANGAKMFYGDESAKVGNYNWLMAGVDKRVYDAEGETFESSHGMFRGAFKGGFPWEVLHVFAPPPRIAFSWRHWARFDGIYRGREGDGEIYDMFGWGIATVNEKLKIKELEMYYKPEDFLKAVEGKISREELQKGISILGDGCPFVNGRMKS